MADNDTTSWWEVLRDDILPWLVTAGGSGVFGGDVEKFLTGGPGRFDQFEPDPNWRSTYMPGMAGAAKRFMDPNTDPILQREMRMIQDRYGVTSQAARNRSLSEAVASHSARAFDVMGRAYDTARPITRYTQPGSGAMEQIMELLGNRD